MAIAIIKKYGYGFDHSVSSNADLGRCLRQLVAYEGESAFKDIMEGHPDKDVILELYGKSGSLHADGDTDMGHGCNCRNCRNKHMPPAYNYLNASGDTQHTNNLMSITNVSIIAASLLLSVAIIMRK